MKTAANTARRVHACGFSPFGAPANTKLRSEAHNTHDGALRDLFPYHLKGSVRLERPYGVNHHITFRCEGVDPWKVKDAFNDGITAKDFKINAGDVNAIAEHMNLFKPSAA